MPVAERRHAPEKATPSQFDFIAMSLKEGDKRFDRIEDGMKKLTETVSTMAVQLAENTELTRKTATLAESTARDTQPVVSIVQGVTKAGHAASEGTRRASRFSRVLLPILGVVGFIGMLWRGEPIHLKDLLELWK